MNNPGSVSARTPRLLNDAGVVLSVYQLFGPNRNLGSALPGLIFAAATDLTPIELTGLNWAGQGSFTYGGFAALVDVSMATDQVGYSYAQQLSLFIGAGTSFVKAIVPAGPAIGDALKLTQILFPSDYNQAEAWLNSFLDSATANNA